MDGRCKDRQRHVEEALWHLGALRRVEEPTVRVLDEEDWASAWKRARRRGDRVVVTVDPGVAFGTGTHPTTQMCLTLLERHLCERDVVLDVGTGSGILAIAAMRPGANRALALDVDPVAVQAALRSVRVNRLRSRMSVELGALERGVGHPLAPFDVAVANITAQVLLEIMPRFPGVLNTGGRLVLSGFLVKREAELASEARARVGPVVDVSHEGEWAALVVRRS